MVWLSMMPGTRCCSFGELVTYDTGDCLLGWLIMAASGLGVCSVTVGANDKEPKSCLRREYPEARIVKSGKAKSFFDDVCRYLNGHKVNLPLDLQCTDFQLRIWADLQRMPRARSGCTARSRR
jgi:AraC family transcriptional regulator of adaptative response/methylated-DNA-[protein]-cysteine methyltransferase